MKNAQKTSGSKSGFTVIELIIALSLSLVLMAALLGSYTQYRRMMKTQELLSELQGNTRAGLQILARNITMTGYGLDLPDSQLEDWITWVDGFNTNPLIANGSDDGPDSISVAAAFRRPASLASASSPLSITVGSGEGANFNTSNKKLIYIGGLELARVTGVSGDTLSISTHPSLTAGLHNTYAAGTAVDLIEVRKFHIDADGGPKNEPCLMMEDYASTSGDYIDALEKALYSGIAAIGIEDLQLSLSEDTVDIEVSGIATETDPSYEDETDHLRRLTIDQRVIMRNM